MTPTTPRGLTTDMVETAAKLDRLQVDVTDLRVSIERLSGDVRASLAKHEVADLRATDVEGRIRSLERRSYAIPGLASLLSVASLVLAIWVSFRH